MDKDFLNIIREIADVLTSRGLRLSVAESCTGGFISNAITDFPGSSKFFQLGVVSYSEESKKSVLGISASLMNKHGMVSEETASAMAEGVRKLGCSDVSLSVTGVAGPESMEGREPGLVYMAVSVKEHLESMGMKLEGGREDIKRQASLEALKFLRRVLDIWT